MEHKENDPLQTTSSFLSSQYSCCSHTTHKSSLSSLSSSFIVISDQWPVMFINASSHFQQQLQRCKKGGWRWRVTHRWVKEGPWTWCVQSRALWRLNGHLLKCKALKEQIRADLISLWAVLCLVVSCFSGVHQILKEHHNNDVQWLRQNREKTRVGGWVK